MEQFVRLLHSLPVLRLSLSYNFVSVGVGGTVVVRQTCDQEVVGLSLSRAHGIYILGLFLTPMCLCHQAIEVGAGLRAMTPNGWEGDCRPGGK